MGKEYMLLSDGIEQDLILLDANDADISKAPSEIKILPLGFVTSQKGNFTVDEESLAIMKEEMKKRGLDIVIDYEHQTLADVQAPAGGWIKDIYIKDGAVVAKVEWTEKGSAYVKNKEYRYLSPVIKVRPSDKKVVLLHSVALTNTPAIDNMYPIVNKLNLGNKPQNGGREMDLKQIAVMLGLPEDATLEQILEALKTKIGEVETLKASASSANAAAAEVVANKTVLGLLSLKEDAKTEDVTAAIMALKSPEGMVPASEFLALKARIDKQEAEGLVLAALKAGKIAAAQKPWAEEYALKDPAGFKAFTDKAPTVVPMGEIELDPLVNKGKAIGDGELKVLKMLGVSKDDIEKYGKDVE